MTDHIKNQLCARIEELEKEKLELNEQLDIAQREAAEARRQAEGEAEVCSSYRGERDALARDLEAERHHRREVEYSEQALAAHVEALTRELTACQSVLHQLARGGEVTPAYADDAKAVLKQAPETSLARLKAQWQAEVLEHIWDRVALAVEIGTVRAHLRNQAAKLRRQAEGGV